MGITDEVSALRPENSVDVYIQCNSYEFVTKTLIPREMSDEILAFEYPNHLSEFMTNLYTKVKAYSPNIVIDDSDIYTTGSFAQNIVNPSFRSNDYMSVKTNRMFSAGYWIPMDFEEHPIVDIVYVKYGTEYLRSPEDWIAIRHDKRFAFSRFNKFYILIRPELNVSAVQVGYIVVKDLVNYEQKIQETQFIGLSVLPKTMVPAFINISVSNPSIIDINSANENLKFVNEISAESLKGIIGQEVSAFRVLFRTLSMGRRVLAGKSISKEKFEQYFGSTEIVNFVLNSAYIE